MILHELIPANKILLLEEYTGDKMELLHMLLNHCLLDTGAERNMEHVWKKLQEREESMSTGIGVGVAVPHCSTEYVNDVLGLMALCSQGLDFQSIDDEPVKIIIMLLFPRDKFDKHIKTLGNVARIFSNKEFRDQVMQVQSVDDAFKLICAVDSPEAGR